MNLLLGFNFRALSTYIIFGIVIALTAITYGQPLLFDRFFLVTTLVASVVVFKLDKNAFTILLILAFFGLSTEALWWIYDAGHGIEFTFIAPVVLGLVGVLYWHDWVSKLGFGVAVICLMAQVYWQTIDYNGPAISWYLIIMAINICIKTELLMRPHRLSQYFNGYGWIYIRADYKLMDLCSLVVLLEAALIAEYLVRHILLMNHVLFVYISYKYIAQLIAALKLTVVLSSVWSTTQSRIIKA